MKRLIGSVLCALAVNAGAHDWAPMGHSVVMQLAAGDFQKVEEQFDARMQAALPVDKLASAWQSVVSQAGAYQSILATRVVQQQGFNVAIVTCAFANATIDAQIAFDSSGKIAGLYFRPGTTPASWSAPPYANPRLFQERAVTVTSGAFQLPGTLTIPIGKEPFPAVVLVHGSGPHDEDETIGPNKPFKDLAWGLAGKGVAVLRYVKRTKQYGAESTPKAGFTVADETVDDARAAVALLHSLAGIDQKRIFVLGHSLGGTLAPRIAENDKNVAGLVIMAGATRPLEDAVVAQLRYLDSLHKSPETEQQIAAAEQAARKIKSRSLRPGSTVSFLGASIPGSYFLDLRKYHPAELAARLGIPMLILQGGHDYQVTREDLDGWKRVLGNRVAYRFYPTLTHLFINSSTTPSPADYDVAGHVEAPVIDDIAAWIESAR